jgi:hypothetical protein
MTAPRTARPYRPAWREPRSGAVASFRCAALAVAIVVLAFAGCSTRAGGQDVPATAPTFPPSVPLAFGRETCRAFVVPNGLAFAAHCRRFGPPRWQGADRPWSVDPAGRDIGHVVVGGYTATLGTAEPGDRLWWQSDRGAGRVRVVRRTTGWVEPGAWHYDRPGQPLFVACVEDGDRFWQGYSGTGLHDREGRPAAIFVGGWIVDEFIPLDLDCGRDQMVLAVPVP